ncbi:hypothetical protein J2X65_003180 [Ancylobacter sp. 3268]|uniref:hypothetical protein n=1 Tax=Ancylobacter sp. 3268 TaxID=2817752 RepID=UPI00285512F8|nr:hypothetical protein [Ancylobacter sp. 3268]MDR6953817.1 hypothetical protein [Ancylobacter sp. 3268]
MTKSVAAAILAYVVCLGRGDPVRTLQQLEAHAGYSGDVELMEIAGMAQAILMQEVGG